MGSRHVVPALLACGVNPNGAGNAWAAPVVACMDFLEMHLKGKQPDWLQVSDPGGIFAHSIDALLSAGADVHVIWDWRDYQVWWWKEYEIVVGNLVRLDGEEMGEIDFLFTPTIYASFTGIEPYWRAALRRNGYDPDEVYAEDDRRRREYVRSHGTTTSAVQLEVPQNTDSTIRPRRGRVVEEMDD
ncbi:hypothetical protein BDV96DRAFT_645859 [Lophiotrema nucula]|uniref:Uncharacterized protein n=1 Tax=Lophiotrema nucula TaxID=690887 RepID=A0A6A5ZAC6_9PLEO|nr:hypothetical protein BDV96DRAFT_645859 [Lophiotrema nucula]